MFQLINQSKEVKLWINHTIRYYIIQSIVHFVKYSVVAMKIQVTMTNELI